MDVILFFAHDKHTGWARIHLQVPPAYPNMENPNSE